MASLDLYQEISCSFSDGTLSNYNESCCRLVRAHDRILEADEVLQKILVQYKKRPKNDQKVAPGSSKVLPEFNDTRFLLCSLCILLGKLHLQMDSYGESEMYFREALLWFPRSVEALYNLGKLCRLVATSHEMIAEAEQFFRKAIQTTSKLEDGSFKNLSKSFADEAGRSLLLLLYQTNRVEEADQILKHLKYKIRINEQVLNHLAVEANPVQPSDQDPFLFVRDQSMPENIFQHLRHVFRSAAPFWSEHRYDCLSSRSLTAGYFSYLYPFKTRQARCFIEQVINRIRSLVQPHFPVLEEANVAEWWVHSRPHICGHQLHFDSDETRIEAGGSPQHPVLTCVLYLSEAGIGGPTVLTNQRLAGDLATKSWMVAPEANRLLIFDARFLHGVLPGVGPTKDVEDRRTTLMVGFWRSLESKDKGNDGIGAGQSFPNLNTTNFTWPREMPYKEEFNALESSSESRQAKKSRSLDSYRYVEPFWKLLNPEDQFHRDDAYSGFFQGF